MDSGQKDIHPTTNNDGKYSLNRKGIKKPTRTTSIEIYTTQQTNPGGMAGIKITLLSKDNGHRAIHHTTNIASKDGANRERLTMRTRTAGIQISTTQQTKPARTIEIENA